jgi:putative protein-disulfide isomerase
MVRPRMTVPTLRYIHDPLCGWCYAVTPMAEVVANAGVPIVLHGGGLWEAATGLAPDKRFYIGQSDARIAELTGMRFGAAYLDGLLIHAKTMFWSRPTIAAVLAAGAIEQGAELRMMHAVQRAHCVEGRRVVEPSVLADVAASICLGADRFVEAFETVPVDDHITATRHWMQQTGLRGFPSFLLERGDDLVRIDHEPFYHRPDAFLQAVKGLAATSPAT